MDIHRPKAAHNWREFLIEIGTIICGILVALALEQGIETMRHHELVTRSEDALRDNFSRFVKFSAMVDREEPCMTARAAEIRAILDDGAKTGRLGRIGVIPQPTPLPWQIDTWQAMIAAGAAPYLPDTKIVLYSRIAMSAVDLYAVATSEWEEWGALRSLSGPPRTFSAAEEALDRDTLTRAVEQARLVRFFAQNTVTRIKGTHLLDQKALDDAVVSGRNSAAALTLCHPISVGDL
jgi:hypothetical protein